VKHKDKKPALLIEYMEVRAGVLQYEDDPCQPIVLVCTLLQWWCTLEQRQPCSRLSCIAITILYIPLELYTPLVRESEHFYFNIPSHVMHSPERIVAVQGNKVRIM
jgi:hypothetical protein